MGQESHWLCPSQITEFNRTDTWAKPKYSREISEFQIGFVFVQMNEVLAKQKLFWTFFFLMSKSKRTERSVPFNLFDLVD